MQESSLQLESIMKYLNSGSNSTPRRLRVIIVDDIPQVLEDLGVLLELDPRLEIVGKADNGLEAVRLVETLHPELILMDLEMPVMDGFKAASVIKSIRPACTIVAHSIHTEPDDKERAVAAGFDLFIEKGTPLDGVLQSFLEKKGE
jgi:DNA-binding NarL/FixJ family response regulator